MRINSFLLLLMVAKRYYKLTQERVYDECYKF